MLVLLVSALKSLVDRVDQGLGSGGSRMWVLPSKGPAWASQCLSNAGGRAVGSAGPGEVLLCTPMAQGEFYLLGFSACEIQQIQW